MEETVEYQYTPKLAKTISREFFLRKFGIPFAVSAILGLYGLISFMMGHRGFIEGVLVTIFVIYLLSWVSYEKRAVNHAKSLFPQSVSVTLNEEGITHNNIDHISIVKWRRFHSVLKLKSAWIFFIYSNSNYTAIPTNLINDSMKNLIEKKMAENHRLIQ